ncbi:bifunctional tetrahydrofolate synthase/dihydrofolate synthase [Zobellella endophytica]|uniref:Dihydrofolate synthase/folylpolyglutamate synthase n=1 Tax=Zobellella endophytica TaxID=2116700 RepID=A0A2P7RBG7_9GAMM|nr:bifunctional tetrahydrofolate synthase/dihydrofolate synthase [Zobellella endophytica]PSJ47586.1 bifunctional tetrahydrofolate synthase/dihydrofolate synthase [Zobellella endophytica]
MSTSCHSPASRSLADWLAVLEGLNIAHIELGLDRMAAVAGRMGLLSLPSHVITVGGTNGKGTTCALLESMLRAGGHSVGVYSSPHLLDYRERVRLNGGHPEPAAFCEAFAAVEAARGDIALTYFEFGTLAALWLFRAAAPEVVLLEVGLGGRLDATNVVASDQTVVTTIALDHTDWLGDNREAIGFEKAGIFRPGKAAVCGDPLPPRRLLEHASGLGTPLYCVGRDYRWASDGRHWSFFGLGLDLADLPLPSLPVMNAATALAVLACSPFRLTPAQIKRGLREARLSGRLQALTPQLWVDVAHNPESAAYLAERLAALPVRGRRLGLVGMLRDKDIAASLAPLRPLVDEWYLAGLAGPRGASADILAQWLPEGRRFETVTAALQTARADCGEQDIVIAFGSFYTVAEVLANETRQPASE